MVTPNVVGHIDPVCLVKKYDDIEPEDVTVSARDLLAQRFETHREHLRAVALRILGSSHLADDAVQETWLRLSRANADTVDNLGGWLTTVVARICLDMLRSRATKGEVPPDEATDPVAVTSPEDEALLAESVGLALLVVLDTLAPSERLAFVLHDIFAVPFEEIAPIVGRTPVAARQLASRARRRVQSDPAVPDASAAAQGEVVAAFLAAARQGDFAGLLRLLDPDVVLRADTVAVDMATRRASAGAPALSEEMRGVDAVARGFGGGAKAARLTLVDGLAGAVVSAGSQTVVVLAFTVRANRVVAIELLADPGTLAVLDLERVQNWSSAPVRDRRPPGDRRASTGCRPRRTADRRSRRTDRHGGRVNDHRSARSDPACPPPAGRCRAPAPAPGRRTCRRPSRGR